MDKYQKRINDLPDDKLIALAEGYGRIVKFTWIISILVWGFCIVVGLYSAIYYTNFPTSLLVFFVGGGFLMLAVFAWIILDYQKTGKAAAAKVSAKGLDYKVESRRAQKQAGRKAMLPVLAMLVVFAIIAIGIRGCMGMGTVSCPKCGSTYSTDHPAGEYIESHGVCARCERDG